MIALTTLTQALPLIALCAILVTGTMPLWYVSRLVLMVAFARHASRATQTLTETGQGQILRMTGARKRTTRRGKVPAV